MALSRHDRIYAWEGLTKSVADYGAVGDGETDDTQAIQDAFDAAGVVTFPPGTYLITERVLIDGDKYIYGNGATILAGGSEVHDGFYCRITSRTVVEDMIFDGARTTWSQFKTGRGLSFENASNPLQNILIRRCTFKNWTSDGLMYSYIANNQTSNLLVENCTFNNNGRQGIAVVGATGVIVRNNTFINSPVNLEGEDIHSGNQRDLQVYGNNISFTVGDHHTTGMHINGGKTGSSNGNWRIFNNTLDGRVMRLYGGFGGTSDMKVFNNIVRNSTTHGIWVNDGITDFEIYDNQVFDSTEKGIFCQGEISGIVRDNLVDGATTGIQFSETGGDIPISYTINDNDLRNITGYGIYTVDHRTGQNGENTEYSMSGNRFTNVNDHIEELHFDV